MKISLNWLKNYVSCGASAEQLAHKLTMAGLEVEKIHSVKGDQVFECEITPNRPDCLSMVGIAREASAIFNKPLCCPGEGKIKIPSKKCRISIVDKMGCQRYVGIVIEDIHIKATSQSIKRHIETIGLRSINNIVDITNFCLMELGQPLHAFDYDKLIGNKIIVRRAKKDEKIITIDDEERKLDPSILVIADAKRPVAIAGIMGGKDTEVTKNTKNILLESAYFDPISIRQASRKLGLSSDSSYRFERGVDYEGVERGACRSASLILKEAKGQVTAYSDNRGKTKTRLTSTINVSQKDINGCLGTSMPASKTTSILKKLGFKVILSKNNNFKIKNPSFRSDVKSDVDIVEEIARIIGYDNIPMSLPEIKVFPMQVVSRKEIHRRIQDALTSQGLNEIITYSTLNGNALTKANQKNLKGPLVQNPLTVEQEMMRPSMLPAALSVVETNINRMQKNLKLFEIGKIYKAKEENDMLAIVFTGARNQDWRIKKREYVNFYDVKGAVESVFKICGISQFTFENSKSEIFETGTCAQIKLKGKPAGSLGKLSEDILNNFNIKEENILFAQLDLGVLYQLVGEKKKYQLIPEYPSIVRDISLAVKKDIPYSQIKNIAGKFGKEILSSIDLIEEYLGDKIASNERGIVFSLTFQSYKRTLREDEVNDVHKKITEALKDELGATIR